MNGSTGSYKFFYHPFGWQILQAHAERVYRLTRPEHGTLTKQETANRPFYTAYF